MKALLLVLVVVGLCFGQFWRGVAPIGKNENNVLYSWDGLDFDIQQGVVGTGGFRAHVLGVDSVVVLFERLTGSHAEVYIEFTGDRANAGLPVVTGATSKPRNIAIYWMPRARYAARTVTTGHRLPLASMLGSRSVTTHAAAPAYAFRTVTVDSTSKANRVMIANISARDGQSTGMMGPFYVPAGAAADSIMSGFICMTADTLGISWRAIVINR